MSRNLHRWAATAAVAIGAAALVPFAPGCSHEEEAPSAPHDNDDRWDNLHFIDKVARALRQGRGLSPDDDVDTLVGMTPEQVVDHFMADAAFIDTVLDFNLYFLGLKINAVRLPDGTLDPLALASRRAVNSALEVERGGNYLSLLALDQKAFVLPLQPPFKPQIESPPDSDAATREYWFTLARSEADQLIALSNAGAPVSELCGAALEFQAFGDLFPAFVGVPFQFTNYFLTDPKWVGPYKLGCVYNLPIDFSSVTQDVRDRLPKLRTFVDEMVARGSAPPRTLDDLHMVDLRRLDMEDVSRRLEVDSFWKELENSSTNYNRRRAAYMLDRFFCDDLKPINAALPDAHTGDRHASDPGCAACHYKLDPMAGFFKDYGQMGVDFSADGILVFDDGAVMDKAAYQASWAAAPGSEHAWNIGYARSATDESQNTYGENLGDLFQIIESAPEVKACVVRRAFEYFNGDEQLVDPGYLAYLTDLFIKEAQGNSTDALKSLVRRVLTGNTFRRSDPRSDECYDFTPGVDPSSHPPCDVAFILQKNCATCHSGSNSQGGLDLTGWTTDASGRQTFPHRSAGGAQRPAPDTFAAILDRITTTDPQRSMPLGRFMAANDREALFLWIENQRAQMGDTP